MLWKNRDYFKNLFIVRCEKFIFSVYLQIIIFVISFFILGLLEIIVINEEVLLTLCFISFMFVVFASANLDVFNSLNQKSKEVKITFLESINASLSSSVSTNAWFFSNNWSSKPSYISSLYGLWGKYELKFNLIDAKSAKTKQNLTFLQDLWTAYSNQLNKSTNSFILASLFSRFKSMI